MSEGIGVRISAATPEADLDAVVWPGVAVVYYPSAERPEQLQQADARINHLERLRGIRPGTIELRPMIESLQGVSRVGELAASSRRVQALGLGPRIHLSVADEALDYVQSECELQARALGLRAAHSMPVLD